MVDSLSVSSNSSNSSGNLSSDSPVETDKYGNSYKTEPDDRYRYQFYDPFEKVKPTPLPGYYACEIYRVQMKDPVNGTLTKVESINWVVPGTANEEDMAPQEITILPDQNSAKRTRLLEKTATRYHSLLEISDSDKLSPSIEKLLSRIELKIEERLLKLSSLDHSLTSSGKLIKQVNSELLYECRENPDFSDFTDLLGTIFQAFYHCIVESDLTPDNYNQLRQQIHTSQNKICATLPSQSDLSDLIPKMALLANYQINQSLLLVNDLIVEQEKIAQSKPTPQPKRFTGIDENAQLTKCYRMVSRLYRDRSHFLETRYGIEIPDCLAAPSRKLSHEEAYDRLNQFLNWSERLTQYEKHVIVSQNQPLFAQCQLVIKTYKSRLEAPEREAKFVNEVKPRAVAEITKLLGRDT